MNHMRPVVVILLLIALLCTSAKTQCSNEWLPTMATSGLGGPGYATTMWGPDGAGALPEHIVIGGAFASAGPVAANNIAAYDPISGTWSAIGAGINNAVRALTVAANGDLGT